MRLWIYGFFMAWGMFLSIPCPIKIWEDAARGKQLACFPLVGILTGALWAAAAWAVEQISLPTPAAAWILAAMPWLLTGFIHLDGFMDVCDAILSRRDLQTRQRILKDSHCGAFAVICMVLLGLGQWSLFLSARTLPLLPLVCIPVAVRASAGLAMQSLRPLSGSQYAALKKGTGRERLLPAVCLLIACVLPLTTGFPGGMAPTTAAIGYWIAAGWGFRQLDGMSGDISGFALTLGELAGAAVLCLMR